ncbi:alpha/beta hydrolase [Subtercola frigoramans]|uniref:Acetyl esterase n=1 Tax=Subtercola frigoramans TaxID=120298 RepID=A0ABS2L338_9MICO|nr:alpha/beta hydrolase [Subtercola frigoramans]MBM7471155.1 acetyl esterase [Subtercola frigoramans]
MTKSMPTPIPARVRAWGWFMDRFRSMHIATMSPADIAHNQTMRHVPAPVRRMLFGSRQPGTTVEDWSVPSLNGHTIPVRIYRPRASGDTSAGLPPAPLPVVIYLHGGGWTLFGGLDMCDWLPSRVAARLGAVVVAVDYRLAPEHPFPAAVDDCYAALEWVSANDVELGVDPNRLAVIGDSAGGNLSAVLTLLARDRSGPPIAAQGLIYPVTDTTLDDESMRENSDKPVLHRDDMAAFFDYYLGSDESAPERSDIRVAPLRAVSFAGLPPTLVQVGEHDVLRDQGVAYARGFQQAETYVELITYPGAPHGWVTYPLIMRSTADRATDDLVKFLSRFLSAPHPSTLVE